MQRKIIHFIYKVIPIPLQQSLDKNIKSDIGKRTAKGAFWSLSGSVISSGLMLLSSIIVARLLGQTEYGELGMIRSTVSMFAVFGGFGLGMTATKFIAEFRDIDHDKTGRVIGMTSIFSYLMGGIIAIAILIFSNILAEKTINAPHLVAEIQLCALMVFFSAVNGAQSGILSGFEKFKSIAKVNIFSGVISFPLQILFTYLWGLTGSVVGFGINYLIRYLLNEIILRQEYIALKIVVHYSSSWKEWPILYKFSLPSVLSGLMVGPVIWVCNTMLVNRANGYDEMAIFDAANQWRSTISFIPGVLSQIVLPLLSSSTSNKIQFKKILNINIKLNFYFSLIISIIISLFATLIMKTYGTSFITGTNVLIILSISTIFSSVNSVIGQAIAGKDKMWIGFFFNLIWGTVLISCSYIFIYLGYGALGLSIAFFIAYLLHTIIQFTFLKVKIYNKWEYLQSEY